MSTSLLRWLLVVATFSGVATMAPAQQLEVTGAVLDHRGGGLAKARVELLSLLPPHRLAELQLAGTPLPAAVASALTDADGRFRLAAPEAGFWQVRVAHDEYLAAIHDLVPLRADRTLPDLALQLRSDLAVRLLDAEGSALAGVTLAARGWSRKWQESSEVGWWPAERLARTGEDGTAAIPCASSEKVSVASLAGEFLAYRVEPCVSGFIELRLEERWSEAVVVHPGGEAAAGVHAFVRWPFVAFGITDAEGRLRGPFDWRGSVPVAFADGEAYYGEARSRAPGQGAPEEPVLQLPATIRAHGLILDVEDRRAVDLAWVWGGPGSRYFQTVEGGGPFHVRMLADAPEMRFGAPGYLSMAHGPPVEDVELIIGLTATRTLAGRVVDTAGHGIAGARISGVAPPGTFFTRQRGTQAGGRWLPGKIEVSTDAAGSFELAGLLPSTPVDLRIERSGYAPHERTVIPPGRGEPAEELVVVLDPGYSGFGRVVDEADAPIAGAVVALIPSLTGAAAGQDFQVGENFEGATGAAGAFVLRDLPTGTYYLSARAPGFPELLVPGVEITASAEPIDLGTVVLVPGIRLFGFVIDGEDEPVPGAELALRSADGEPIVVQRAGSPWFASATSRPDGSFEIEGLPRASRLTVLVTADGLLPREEAVTMGEQDLQLTVVLSAGALVAGVVVDPSGRPAPDAEVALEAVGSLPTATSRRLTSDERGRFEAAGLQPGEYLISARAADARSDPIRRGVPAEGLADLYLELRWKSSLRVSVLDPAGGPVPSATLRGMLDPATTTNPVPWRSAATGSTDEAGAAVLRPLDTGTYRVSAFHPDFETVSATVEIAEVSEGELELRFEQPRDDTRYRISGRVVDSVGAPVGGARLYLASAHIGSSATSDADGRFEILAPAGEVRLRCVHERFASYLGELFTLGEGGVSDLVVELSAGATVVGRVSGLEPEELARLVIVARGPLLSDDRSALFGRLYGSINYAGELRIPGLSVGDWLVRAELLNPTRSAVERIEVDRGDGEVRVDLQFEDGYRVTGSVLRGGQPVAAQTVRLSCFGEFRGETFTDAEGRFVIEHVPSARCTARSIDSESGRATDQRIEVLGDTDIVLELGPSGL
ncbi:MAG: carboxypeptidase regulatory-like domain-containing protein [bacterium]|nr:carboxypeptidase regulatory-like domain-containing protein [bacterium]